MTRAPYDNEPIGLRDYFAAKAMQGLVSAYIIRWRDDREDGDSMAIDTQASNLPDLEADMDELIAVAFAISDQMLAARQPPSPPAPTPDVEELCDE
jgi:hypothetical protein